MHNRFFFLALLGLFMSASLPAPAPAAAAALSTTTSANVVQSHDEAGSGATEQHDDSGQSEHSHDAAPREQIDESAPHSHDSDASHQETGAVVPAEGEEPAAHPHTPATAHEAAPDHHDGATTPGTDHNDVGAIPAADHHGGGGEADGHSHWGESGPQSAFDQAMESLGKFHSLLVHFPIALILAAALAQILGIVRKEEIYADTVRFLVWTGALGGVAAGLLGWAHSGPMAADEAGIMLFHRILGTGLMFGLFGVAMAVEWRRRDASAVPTMVMYVSLFGAAAAVAINGFLGGSLAHGGVTHLMGGG